MTAARRLLWLADVLEAEGLRVVRVPGWQTRGTATIDPRVLIDHHTASRQGRNAPSLDVVAYRGNGSTPAPLSNLLTGRDGTVFVVASGRTNNAGYGSWGPLSAYGNAHTIGHEIENDGIGEPWPAFLLDVVATVDAAICRRLGWDASHVIGHKEWAPGRKTDPTYNMGAHRARVTARLQPADTKDDDTMVRLFIETSYRAVGADPDADTRGVDYWWTTAMQEAPARHWTYADCLASPALGTMVALLFKK